MKHPDEEFVLQHVAGRGLCTVDELIRYVEAAGLLEEPLVRALVNVITTQSLDFVAEDLFQDLGGSEPEEEVDSECAESMSVDDWLRAQLADGRSMALQDLLGLGIEAGFSKRSIERSAKRLGVVSKKLGGYPNRVEWSLPRRRKSSR